MSSQPSMKIDTPIGNLEWVFITDKGREDLNGNPKFSVSVVIDPKQVDPATTDKQAAAAAAFLKSVEEFWAANKPKGREAPDTTGIKPHMVNTGNKDEDGDPIYEDDGKYVVNLKTGTEYQDGKPKVIKTFNSKGAEVNLGGKKIGNGSRGRAGGIMSLYVTKKGKAIANAGVTFYLNSVQLSKFVEFTGGDSFDAIDEEDDDEDGGFEGIGDMGAIPDEPAEQSTKASGPRLD